MPKPRSYRLLCPIARALDRVGDRWTLLILRDLHAGSARFSELQQGLPGLASNLLTSRLRQLEDDGLVRHGKAAHGAQVYELTVDGEATGPLLFALGNYGARFAPSSEVRRPGNLRTVAVNLKESLRRVAEPTDRIRVELLVDGEAFSVRVEGGAVRVRYGPDPEAMASITMEYEALIDVVDGRIPPTRFLAEHVTIPRDDEGQAAQFLGLMGRGFAQGA